MWKGKDGCVLVCIYMMLWVFFFFCSVDLKDKGIISVKYRFVSLLLFWFVVVIVLELWILVVRMWVRVLRFLVWICIILGDGMYFVVLINEKLVIGGEFDVYYLVKNFCNCI